MMITTYQHDYVAPHIKRYDFSATGDGPLVGPDQCQCIEDNKVEIPKQAFEHCADTEWTGIAPMGRLTNPRIIPAKLSPKQISELTDDPDKDCFKTQPNRFLQILRSAYPDLYERLKQMPREELNRRIERQRLLSTYQIDFCNMNEYPEGVYESLKTETDTATLNASKLLTRQGPCAEFRDKIMDELDNEVVHGVNVDPCSHAYKPFKITFADSSRFTDSGNNSHWRLNTFAKRANFTEYMDTISRNGCVIIRNKLHDHSKCINGRSCKHTLTHTCNNMRN